ncbi:MAG: diguanylate cyclase [Burkholderiales bacterium]|nr:diguanylate cyclase [Burkholderiales bacterium]
MAGMRLWMLMLLVAGLGLLLTWGGASWAQAPMKVQTSPAFAGGGEWWLDTTGELPPHAVATSPTAHWQPLAQVRQSNLGPGQALWVRFTLLPTMKSERAYLEVTYSTVDRVVLYARDPVNGQWLMRHQAGDRIPVSQWPVPHRYPMLPVTTSPDQATDYLLRIENMHGFSAPLLLESESAVHRADQRVTLLLGAFFGLGLLAAVVSLLSAVALRDGTYALYSMSVMATALVQAAMTGMAGLHLWPDSPVWTDRAPFVLSPVAASLMMLTMTAIVSTRERSPALWRAVLALLWVSMASAVLVALEAPAWRGLVPVVSVTLCSVVAVGVMCWAWYRGDRYAPWTLLATLPVALAAAFPVARLAGWVPATTWTHFIMQFAIAVELPVLLLVLMHRSRQQRENSRRLQRESQIDPSTGLGTERLFLSRARRTAERAQQRWPGGSAIFVVEVCNVAELQRKFGRRALEDVPLRVSSRILAIARDIDTVARLGEYRFGLLLDGPVNPADIEATGARLVARCLMPHEQKPQEWVTRVHVAYAVLPHDGSPVTRIVELLHHLLDAVPEGSRKAVFALAEPPRAG